MSVHRLKSIGGIASTITTSKFICTVSTAKDGLLKPYSTLIIDKGNGVNQINILKKIYYKSSLDKTQRILLHHYIADNISYLATEHGMNLVACIEGTLNALRARSVIDYIIDSNKLRNEESFYSDDIYDDDDENEEEHMEIPFIKDSYFPLNISTALSSEVLLQVKEVAIEHSINIMNIIDTLSQEESVANNYVISINKETLYLLIAYTSRLLPRISQQETREAFMYSFVIETCMLFVEKYSTDINEDMAKEVMTIYKHRLAQYNNCIDVFKSTLYDNDSVIGTYLLHINGLITNPADLYFIGNATLMMLKELHHTLERSFMLNVSYVGISKCPNELFE